MDGGVVGRKPRVGVAAGKGGGENMAEGEEVKNQNNVGGRDETLKKKNNCQIKERIPAA